jgi:hypothetical protein
VIRDGEKVGIRIRDEQPGSYFLELRNHFIGLKYLNSFLLWIRDPGWQNSDPGSGMAKFGSGIRVIYTRCFDDATSTDRFLHNVFFLRTERPYMVKVKSLHKLTE